MWDCMSCGIWFHMYEGFSDGGDSDNMTVAQETQEPVATEVPSATFQPETEETTGDNVTSDTKKKTPKPKATPKAKTTMKSKRSAPKTGCILTRKQVCCGR